MIDKIYKQINNYFFLLLYKISEQVKHKIRNKNKKMSCDCCLDEEDKYQENVRVLEKVYSNRNLSKKIDQSYAKYRYENQHPKISLRRKGNLMGSGQIILKERTDYTRSLNMGIVRGHINVVNFNQPVRNGNTPQNNKPKVFFTSNQPQINGTPIYFNQNPQQQRQTPKIFTDIQEQQQNRPQLMTSQPRPPHLYQYHSQPSPQVLKSSKPQVKIVYQQTPVINKSINTQVHTVIKSFNTAADIQPIKVSFEEFPSPSRDDQENRWFGTQVVSQLKHRPRKSSIQFDRNSEDKDDDFRGKFSCLQLKKISSLADGLELFEQKIQNSKLVRSTRINGQHIEDIECKKTQSIAEPSIQSEQSEVVPHSDFLEIKKNQQKMTHSETKFQKNSSNLLIENKRSIIWEHARKQSFFQI